VLGDLGRRHLAGPDRGGLLGHREIVDLRHGNEQ
jgi:hypothetical protein